MLDIFLRAEGGDKLMSMFLHSPAGVVRVGVGIAGRDAPALTDSSPVGRLLSERPFYVAHRLGGTEFPEHTMAGLQAAISAGFTAFEFSTYRTSDGVFIGSHDWTTERTTGVRYEIWDTDWATIQSLSQEAGPIIRIEDAVGGMPEGSVLVLDHKATSARSDFHADSRASESELFDLLDTLFDVPQDRVIWKVFGDSDSDSRARERGYKTMCMLYPGDLPTADLGRWDVLGMEWNAPQEAWDAVSGAGKPTIGHIITNKSHETNALQRGADGIMSSVPSISRP